MSDWQPVEERTGICLTSTLTDESGQVVQHSLQHAELIYRYAACDTKDTHPTACLTRTTKVVDFSTVGVTNTYHRVSEVVVATQQTQPPLLRLCGTYWFPNCFVIYVVELEMYGLRQVRSKCGHVVHGRRRSAPTVATPVESATTRHRHRHDHHNDDDRRRGGRVTSLRRQFVDVAHGLLSTRELFVRLPHLLCRSDHLRVGRDDVCWNGTALAP